MVMSEQLTLETLMDKLEDLLCQGVPSDTPIFQEGEMDITASNDVEYCKENEAIYILGDK
jgi:hypothetical protein